MLIRKSNFKNRNHDESFYSLFFLKCFQLPVSFLVNGPTTEVRIEIKFPMRKGLRVSWGNDEPKVIWELDVGLGYSSIVESDGLVYTQGNKNSRNTLYCVNAESGNIIWKHTYPCKKDPKYFDGGSRSTPAIANKMVFLCSHEGDLYALDAYTGDIKWTKNLLT